MPASRLITICDELLPFPRAGGDPSWCDLGPRLRGGKTDLFADVREMKYLPHTLVALILAIQYPLWMGKGSWLRVWEFSGKVDQQKEKNVQLAARNAGLDAEVRDLKQGTEAVEERARVELGMIKPGEVFYQVTDKSKVKP